MRIASLLESEHSRKFSRVLVRRRKPLGLLLYVAGLVYLSQLPRDEFNRRSFIDENALMVGLVRREFSDPNSISRYSSQLAGVYGNREELVRVVEGELARLGLEVYRQNYTARRPAVLGRQKEDVAGCNVYGILRAGRSSGAEALVLSAPYSPVPSSPSFPSSSSSPPHGGERNVHGLSLMLALADYFRSKNYWAKDIIFLMTSEEGIGTQAWIDAYMGGFTPGIEAGALPGRSGAIQAVINLEVSTPIVHYVDVIIEGVNGILPNLDLVHVVTHSSEMEGIPTSFHNQWENLKFHSSATANSRYLHQLRTVVAIIAHQASGLPLANHALFLRHRIDSVTVRAVPASGPNSHSLLSLARSLENSFRSLNNLLERLHHSEFFYYPPSRSRFISIGLFMPPLALLLAPLILEGLTQWLLARGAGGSEDDTTTTQGPQVTTPFPLRSVLSLILLSASSGVLLLTLPLLVAQLLSPPTLASLLASLAWGCCLSIFIPVMSSSTMEVHTWHMAKCFSLLLQLLLLLTVSLMNYALAVCLTLFLPLPSIFSGPPSTSRKVTHQLQQVLLLLSCPPLSVLLLCSLYHAAFTVSTIDPATALEGGASLLTEGLVRAYTSWYFFGCWLFPVGCLAVWPVWLMGWRLSCQGQSDGHMSVPESGPSSHPHSD